MGMAITHEHSMSNFGAEINEVCNNNEAGAFKPIIACLKN